MRQTTRRRFLFTMGAAAAVVPNLKFPKQPRDRIAVASYPFRAIMDVPNNPDRDASQPAVALKDFAAMVAEKLDIHGIEPLSLHFASTEPAYLAELRTAVDKARSRIVNIPVDLTLSLYDPDDTRRQAAVADAKKWVDVAVAVNSLSVRVHIARVKDLEPDQGRAAASLKEIAAYGESKRVVINLENDDLESENAFFLVRVLQAVGSSYLHALPDFGNSMVAGDEQYNYRAMTGMFRAAYNIAHVKDGEMVEGKFVAVDLARTFGIAKANDFRGYYSIEFEGEGSPLDGTRRLIEQTLKYM